MNRSITLRRLCAPVLGAAVAAASMVVSTSSLIPTPASAATDLQTIYMSPTGSDAADGSAANPVQSLVRVQELVKTPPAGYEDANVEVRIKGGTYVAAPITWTTYRPGHTISFMPIDYVAGQGRASVSSMPVFENKKATSGRYITGSWFTGCLPASGPLSSGGDSGLRFHYLTVTKYANAAISLNGSGGSCLGSYHASSGLGQPSAKGLDGAIISGMTFTQLGNAYTGGTCSNESFKRCGYGAIVLTESSRNTITNNHFVDLRNTEKSYIHAVYITHKSSSNRVTSNNIRGVSSGPLKVRDSSNYNTFENNTFGANDFARNSIPGATHYLEEVGTGECSSFHNRLANNKLGTLLYGSGRLPAWQLVPAGATYKGGADCPALPAGEVRLTAVNNTY